MVRNMEKDQQLVRSIWPEWVLADLIGFGTLGRVYKAYRHKGASNVYSAIKIVALGCEPGDVAACTNVDSHIAGMVWNWINEIRKLKCLNNCPNIVEIQDFSVCRGSGGKPWTVLIRMELLRNLYDDLDGRKITDRYVSQIGVDLCHALEMCFARHIVHRGIRPAKVYVNDSGVYKLGFDLVRQMRERIPDNVIMTSKYTAPEIINHSLNTNDFGRAHLADIYSLGLLLYWIANGRMLPFLERGNLHTMEEYARAFRRKMNGAEFPPPPGISAPLQKAILKGCVYDPMKRYCTAREFLKALEGVK